MTKQQHGMTLSMVLALATGTAWATPPSSVQTKAAKATTKDESAKAPPDQAGAVTSYSVVLPVAASLVAWLPASGQADAVDLDLRVEVVLPHGCGDRLEGLLLRDAGDDASYEAVVGRPTGLCTKEAKRVSARTVIRIKLAPDATRTLRLGQLRLQVARPPGSGDVTLDGAVPTGDVPGAPPTARPSVLVLGEVRAARLMDTASVAGEAHAVAATIGVQASWPRCAEAPLGFLGSGDASTGFAITHFMPLAVMPQDRPCKPRAERTTIIPLLARSLDGDVTHITVGKVKLDVPAWPATK